MQEENIAPSVNLLQSMRSVGYSFAAALADLIDNSITAGASMVEIDGDVVDGAFVAVLDDGRGMSAATAREALRLAGTSGERDSEDLGRFGLGLKTASLSQGRRVTVASRQDGATTVLRWDIDHVLATGRWALLVLDDQEAAALPLWGAFDQQEQGTLVVWHDLDLLLGDTGDPGGHLRDRLVEAGEALSLVFHRFLRPGQAGLTLRVNGVALDPLDPFLESNTRTQASPTDELRINGERVQVTAFTLPHPTGLTPAERARKDMSIGMRDAQGIYVYRNRRLVSHGGWHGIVAKSELTKQTRIRVDIPNTLDHLWQLDIKKSRTEPPASFRAHIKRLLEPLLERGRRVHTFRGRRSIDAHLTRVWDKLEDRNGRVTYVVNTEHPMVALLRSALPAEKAGLLDSVLEILQSNFPAQDLYAVMAASGTTAADDPQRDTILTKLRMLHAAGALGASRSEATAQLSAVEPFNRVDNLSELVEAVIGKGADGAN